MFTLRLHHHHNISFCFFVRAIFFPSVRGGPCWYERNHGHGRTEKRASPSVRVGMNVAGCTLAYPPPADTDTLAPADTDTLAPTVSGSTLSVWCRPSLFPIKTRIFSSNCLMTTALKDLTLKAARHWVVNLILRFVSIVFVVVCSFQCLSGNDIGHMTEGDFRLSCCERRFSF